MFPFSLVSLFAVGACSSSPEPTGQSQEAIERGQLDTGDPAVGLLTDGTIGCTAVLIDPSWIISAAHCRQNNATLVFKTGSSPADFVAHAIDQNSYAVEPNTQTMLMRLVTPIYTIDPLHLGRTLPTPGTYCRAVGFGIDSADGVSTTGTKRDGWEQVTTVPDPATSTIITVSAAPAIADHGDSGGPLICNGGFVDGLVYGHADGEWPNHTSEMYTMIPFDWLEQQTGGVLFRCTPRTCAGASATCGTISDFCGGTLTCGTCASDSTCTVTNVCCPTANYDPTTGACGSGTLNCPSGTADCGGYCCRCRPGRCG